MRRVLIQGGAMAHLVGTATGRTTVRAFDVQPRADSRPMRAPLPSRLERYVLVTRGIERVQLVDVPDSVRVGTRMQLGARAIDIVGDTLRNVSVTVRVGYGELDTIHGGPPPILIFADRPGRLTIVAEFGGAADTASVTVVE
jgi:hypothetical protein